MRGIAAGLLLCLAASTPAQIDTAELTERSAFEQRCQPLVDDGRTRIAAMNKRASDDYETERKACGPDLDCLKRAKSHAGQRAAEIKTAQANIDRQIRDCAASLKAVTPAPRRPPSPAPARVPIQNEPTTPSGDWDPVGHSPVYPAPKTAACQDRVASSRERIRQLQNESRESYRIERANCGRDLKCMDRATSANAQRARGINIEQTRLTAEIRDCQAASKHPSTQPQTTPDGDWIPPATNPCAGFVEYAGRRVRKLQNEANEQYSADRIACGRDPACVDRTRTTAAQRSQAVKAENARLQNEIRNCRVRNSAP